MKIALLIPACGLGTRVSEFGPKPFIKLHNRLALEIVMDMAYSIWHEPIPAHIGLPAHLGCPPLQRPANVHLFDKATRGQADTLAQLVRRIGRKRYDWILVSNCDNVIDADSFWSAVAITRNRKLNGVLFTFEPLVKGDTRFSYVTTNNFDVISIAEKKAISNQALTGVYLLRTKTFMQAYRERDIYLSATLARMSKLIVIQAMQYKAWNDVDQIKEYMAQVKQHL
jgi:NDP-sugar pyrophosphorylase family protein